MAAKRCELLVRDQIASQAPDWKTIMHHEQLAFQFSVDSPFKSELAKFKELLADSLFDQLVARYPLKNSRVFDEVARSLEFSKRELYEQTLIARIKSDCALAKKLRKRIGPLSLAIGDHSAKSPQDGE